MLRENSAQNEKSTDQSGQQFADLRKEKIYQELDSAIQRFLIGNESPTADDEQVITSLLHAVDYELRRLASESDEVILNKDDKAWIAQLGVLQEKLRDVALKLLRIKASQQPAADLDQPETLVKRIKSLLGKAGSILKQ